MATTEPTEDADEEQDWSNPADDAEMVAAFCIDWLGHLPAPEEPDRCEKCDLILPCDYRKA